MFTTVAAAAAAAAVRYRSPGATNNIAAADSGIVELHSVQPGKSSVAGKSTATLVATAALLTPHRYELLRLRLGEAYRARSSSCSICGIQAAGPSRPGPGSLPGPRPGDSSSSLSSLSCSLQCHATTPRDASSTRPRPDVPDGRWERGRERRQGAAKTQAVAQASESPLGMALVSKSAETRLK